MIARTRSLGEERTQDVCLVPGIRILLSQLVNLEPLQGLSARARAVGSGALSEVGDHGTDVVGPDLVPVCSDRGTGGNGRGQLKSSWCTVVIAGKCRVGSILNGVANHKVSYLFADLIYFSCTH